MTPLFRRAVVEIQKFHRALQVVDIAFSREDVRNVGIDSVDGVRLAPSSEVGQECNGLGLWRL